MEGLGQTHPTLAQRGSPIYCDYNGTTPVDPAVASAVASAAMELFGNPSSAHAFGRAANAAVTEARQNVASMVSAKPDEVIFTGCGSESINTAIKGLVMLCRRQHPKAGLPHVVITAIEHPAVVQSCRSIEQDGLAEVTIVPCLPDGTVSPDAVAAAITPTTVCVSIMHANNETGVIQPVAAIAEIVQAVRTARPVGAVTGPWLHVDASQSVGKVPVSMPALGADLLSFSGHKFYATKGIGVLVVREGAATPARFIDGAGQEASRRAGTENTVLIAGIGVAAKMVTDHLHTEVPRLRALRQKLLAGLISGLGGSDLASAGLTVHGPAGDEDGVRLPNTLSVSVHGTVANEVVAALSSSVALSAGAACHAGSAQLSAVLAAMAVPLSIGLGTLRISLGRFSTEAEVEEAAKRIAAAATSLRVSGLGHSAAAAGAGASAEATDEGAVAAATVSSEPVYMEDTTATTLQGARVLAVAQVPAGSDSLVVRCSDVAALPVGSELGRPAQGYKEAIVLDRCLFHPQGGGQPSDVGLVTAEGDGTRRFLVQAARKGSRDSDLLSGAILLFGRHLGGDEGGIDSGDDVEVPAATSGRGKPGDEPLQGVGAARLLRAGSTVLQSVRADWRHRCAQLHSAGHLLDLAMKRVGMTELKPGKGYHFEDGPFVEYIGVVPAERRGPLVEELQAELARLLAHPEPTAVSPIKPSDAAQLAAVGLPADALEGFPEEQPVRVVSVGSRDNGCPCGGTHVTSASDLAGLKVTRIRCKKGRSKVSYVVEA